MQIKSILCLPTVLAISCSTASGAGKKPSPHPQGEKPAQTTTQKLRDEFRKESGRDPEKIVRTIYMGKEVYLVIMPCCDNFNWLTDVEGKKICSPSGGFAGNGDGKCTDFKRDEAHEVVTWSGNP